LRKAASTKAESTTAESVIRTKQLVRKNGCMCFHIVSAKIKKKKKGRRHGKKERKEDVLAYPVDLHEKCHVIIRQ
jgi:hypothetical protein